MQKSFLLKVGASLLAVFLLGACNNAEDPETEDTNTEETEEETSEEEDGE
ncbi:hypothetical protein [Metabacillus arenae]|uniref:Lipoprotein n=1 Tax=Metabacillus arenae TaxID=2771434 RepID=A0A926RYW2_9BACI|nr:hypothetical protein [Metabacillus arenae]MBD1381587.1 hypothetical protein [Metabacillus arenae]